MNGRDTEAGTEDNAVDKVWRDGQRLVLHDKKAILPKRCVACNAPTDGTLTPVGVRERIPLFVFCWRAFSCLPLFPGRGWNLACVTVTESVSFCISGCSGRCLCRGCWRVPSSYSRSS